jgi:hypothetical protein
MRIAASRVNRQIGGSCRFCEAKNDIQVKLSEIDEEILWSGHRSYLKEAMNLQRRENMLLSVKRRLGIDLRDLRCDRSRVHGCLSRSYPVLSRYVFSDYVGSVGNGSKRYAV